jgi:hypothetical protein
MTPAEAIVYLQGVPADEPVFVLRAKDAYAPSTVGSWAAMCLGQNSVDKNGEPEHPRTLDKGRRAMTLANDMYLWQQEHGSKVPD